MGSLLSNFPPIIDKIKIENDKTAERIQKKQKAWILKNIIFIRRILNVEEPQEIKKINHHNILLVSCLGETIFKVKSIDITNNEE